MKAEHFFHIMGLLEKYAHLHPKNEQETGFSDDLTGKDRYRYVMDRRFLQTDFQTPGWEDYAYFFFDRNGRKLPTSKIHAFLQGAVSDAALGETEPDTSFLNYQEETLKMLFGMYVFIDSTKSESMHPEDQVPHYLLGPMSEKSLKPTFNYKFFYQIENSNGIVEFREPPSRWLQFFLAFNEYTRDAHPFIKQDFVKLFNFEAYKSKRASPFEKENHIAYVSSGEMDHCILQWVALYLKEQNPRTEKFVIDEGLFEFDLFKMYPNLGKFYHDCPEKDYFVPNYQKRSSHPPSPITPRYKLIDWLIKWGLVFKGKPTDRLLAAMEWFGNYLEDLEVLDQRPDDVKSNHAFHQYLTLPEVPENDAIYYYFKHIDESKKRKFLDLLRAKLDNKSEAPVKKKRRRTIDYQVVELYFELLFSYTEPVADLKPSRRSWERFAERCRFRPFVHLLFRNFITAASGEFVERNCRGFIVLPILTRYQHDENLLNQVFVRGKEDINYVGYFIGHLQENYEPYRPIKNRFPENFLSEFKQIIHYLGKIEIERIYYKGIVHTHQQNAIRQSINSAVAACMSRNLSHTTGSHKSPWFKNFWSMYLKELQDYYHKPSNLPPYMQKGIESLGLNYEQAYQQAQGNELVKMLNVHLLSYFDFVNDNMEFIADVTTGIEAEKVTIHYSVKEMYEEYWGLKLMHHGLFDDKKMSIHVEFLSTDDSSNNYSDAVASIPNGQLGKTAFFVIIENVIRNYHKHTAWESNDPHFYIRVTSQGKLKNEYWCVDFFDIVKGQKNKKRRDKTLLNRINEQMINRSIIQTDGTLRPEGWGFLEMKACCAYLVNFPVSQIDQLKNDEGYLSFEQTNYYPLLEANYYTNSGRKVSDLEKDTSSRNLGYRFYLKKAKKVGIDGGIVSLMTRHRQQIIDIAEMHGVSIIDDLDTLLKQSFEIVVLEKAPLQLDPNQRILIRDVIDLPKKQDSMELERNIWVFYINKTYSEEQQYFEIASNHIELEKLLKSGITKEQIFLIDDHGSISSDKNYSYDDLKPYRWYLPKETRTKKDVDLFLGTKSELLMQARLVEVLNTRISIFDERIQQEAQTPYNNSPQLSLREIHMLGNIYIPSGDDLDLTADENINSLEGIMKKRLIDDDYLIIHFTLFEKLAESRGYSKSLKELNNVRDYYKKLVQNWDLERKGKFIVFSSGRGRPANLFSGCYYLHLSTLQYFTIRMISKYSLVSVLKSLRKL